MEEKTRETVLKLSKNQLQIVINDQLNKEKDLNDLFSMLVNGLMLVNLVLFWKQKMGNSMYKK